MTSLHVGMNSIPEKEMKEIITIAMCMDSMKILCEVPIKDKALTELDISGQDLGMEGALVVAEYLRDNGAISSINLLKNRIPVWQAQELVKIMQAKEKLITLCGLSKEETELDFSGQDLVAGDAVLIANDISDMGALSSLNLSENNIGQCTIDDGGGWTLWDDDFEGKGKRWKNKETGEYSFGKYVGAIALADAIPSMGALSKLDVRDNHIPPAEEVLLQGACDAKGVSLRL
jgi:hypothetical protein